MVKIFFRNPQLQRPRQCPGCCPPCSASPGCAIDGSRALHLSRWGQGRGPSQADSSEPSDAKKRTFPDWRPAGRPRWGPKPSSFLEPRTSETGIQTSDCGLFPFLDPPSFPTEGHQELLNVVLARNQLRITSVDLAGSQPLRSWALWNCSFSKSWRAQNSSAVPLTTRV